MKKFNEKVQYKKTLVHCLLSTIDTKPSSKDKLKQITVLDVMYMLCSSWRNITDICIKGCCKKAVILLSKENECVDEGNATEKLLNDISEDYWLAVSGGHSAYAFNDSLM
ncbi:DDE-1 domain-containing protein [Nephila pilipes]|uniref:DDE-1 domain-containing protein n=1 Tax=Nephila pilipes TaxID=299642 RepID=A0A8X6UAL9_NEPPI|nr:DDE-1 domain-containing protein [Nephila pilipes]